MAPLLARSLDVSLVSLNEVAREIQPKQRGHELEVEPSKLRAALLKAAPRGSLVYGHLLPHVLRRPETSMVAVLRCDPAVLRRRLAARGYPRDKVVENVEAELIGVVLDECIKTFGPAKVAEYDTTSSSPPDVARRIARDASAWKPGARGREWTDWTLDYDSSSKLRSLLDGDAPPAST